MRGLCCVFLLNNALLNDDVGVDGSLTGLQDTVAVLCLIVEVEAVDVANSVSAAVIVLGNDLLVGLPNGDLQILVARHLLHEHHRLFHIGVGGDHLQDGIQQLGDTVAVGPEEDGALGFRHGSAGEVAVTDADPVGMAHFAQDLQKFGGEDRGDVFQHKRVPPEI